MSLNLGFPKALVFKCVKLYLVLFLIMKVIMNKKVISIILNVAKYIITLLLGYFGGNAVF